MGAAFAELGNQAQIKSSGTRNIGRNLPTNGQGLAALGSEGESPYYNTLYGLSAGASLTTGSNNAFVGVGAGYSNATGSNNSFLGNWTGSSNTTGNNNSFFGLDAGPHNTTVSSNSFFGNGAGISNTTESNNTYIGSYSNGTAGITNSTSIGYRASGTQGNSLVLGSINGVNGATVDTKVGIGTTSPGEKLEVAGNIKLSGTGNSITFPDGSSLSSASAVRIRGITYLAGCDTCGALADTDDQRAIYVNLVGPMTINSVTCFSDAGTPTINLQRDDGTPSNILSSDLSCSPTGATSTGVVGTESVLNLNDKVDFIVVSAGGVAKRVTIAIKATVN